MTATTERTCKQESNAWGAVSLVCRQRFQIEATDARTTRAHYLGHNHRTLTFTHNDIGKVIEVLTDNTGWTCWSFATE